MTHCLFEDLFENKRDQKRRTVARFAIAAAAILEQKQESERQKQWGEWTKKWLLWWDEKRLYDNLVSELRLEEWRQYQNFLRMTEENFDKLLYLIREKTAKQDTVMRSAIASELKFA